MEWEETEELSNLAYIDVKAENPFVLFKDWQQEARTFSSGIPNALCLATVSKDGKASARHVILRRLDEDGFVVTTSKRSLKAHDLSQVPSAVMCFLWVYKKDTGEHISRQVKIEGNVEEMRKEDYQELYDKEPLYCKIRSHICDQGSKVDWKELKAAHDRLLQDVKEGNATLPMPDHFVGYRLAPSSMEFYHARDHLIADRVLFRRDSVIGNWNHHHIAA